MSFARAVAIVLLLFFSASGLEAWGSKGHRLIGELAEARLKSRHPKVLKRIRRLLGAGFSLASLSVCADEIRDYARRRAANPGTVLPQECLLTGEEVSRLYPDTAAWHYVNLPVSHDARETLDGACRQTCITAQIDLFTARLRDKKRKRRDRAIALMFLAHLVGDLHQPLHAADRDQDQGGNRVYVRLGRRVSRLHSLWDTLFVDNLSAEKIAAARLPLPPNGDPRSWARESHELAITDVYRGVPRKPSSPERPIVLFDPEYRLRAEAVSRQRIHDASVRLANLLADSLLD